ncbi:ArsR/SmtB family transcription factor [Kordiimonas marina]|uniref:metalloregulator ArsR/SmtB family transcription factor n=1 Tax=Kordiimonas marina TaxID=2872312 RepID=UPI001FF47890|nr:metalloregulator ArsR/SmtB family transcription factor [Kordiimonas marina]MCJ9429607.1 metalloregulator ArsR/SmtB family transcription factor [Kordiimonas marina]
MTEPAALTDIRQNAEEVAGLLKTLSHPNRLLTACTLMDGEKSVSDIERLTGVRQPGLSRELARLRDEGLVTTRRESKAVFYRLDDDRLERLVNALCLTFGTGTITGGKPVSAETLSEMLLKPDAAPTFPKVTGKTRSRIRLSPDPYRKE